MASSADEARAYLQERLVLHSKVLFWAFGSLLLFYLALYRMYPEIEPRAMGRLFTGALPVLALLAASWRILVLARAPSFVALHVIDIAVALGLGAWFGASAFFAPELRACGYTALLTGIFAVFTRAIIVPASPRRTAIVSSIALAPLAAAAIGLAFTTKQDIPRWAYLIGGISLCVMATVLATLGSGVMQGLRRKVDASLRLGQYTLDRKIGEGGMGVVYRAHHVLLRRPTAIKLLQKERLGEDALDRFEREVQHTSQLTHPNTVAVFDYGRSPDGVFYYAMEYLNGIDLEQLVRTYGPQPAGRVVRILEQVCGALQEAHDRNLIHRDIKPANIILCQRGGMPDVAKVVDFGLAKEIASEHGHKSQTIVGTPAFLAPEAITTPEKIGPAADLYALGAVGYFLLAGRRVFEGANALDTCLKHVTTAPVPVGQLVDGIPASVASLVMRCLEKDPAARHASANELAADLRRCPSADWPIDSVRRWWAARTFVEDAAALTRERTRTITIELGGRR